MRTLLPIWKLPSPFRRCHKFVLANSSAILNDIIRGQDEANDSSSFPDSSNDGNTNNNNDDDDTNNNNQDTVKSDQLCAKDDAVNENNNYQVCSSPRTTKIGRGGGVPHLMRCLKFCLLCVCRSLCFKGSAGSYYDYYMESKKGNNHTIKHNIS